MATRGFRIFNTLLVCGRLRRKELEGLRLQQRDLVRDRDRIRGFAYCVLLWHRIPKT